MSIRASLTAVAVLALAGSAFADLAFVTNTASAFGTTDGADQVGLTNGTANVLNAVDASFVTNTLNTDPNANGGGFSVHTSITGTGGNDDWVLWIQNNVVGTVFLTQILITDAGGNTATTPGSYTVNLTGVSPGTGNWINFRLPALPRTGAGAYNYSSANFNFNTMATVDFVFSFAAVGDTLALNAISNPEPGTMALFALGAAGLGGFAWRRRNARKLALAKA